MVVPPKHPKMMIFSRKTNSCWVPPFKETPMYFLLKYTPVNEHSWLENGPGWKMYFLLNMGIFQPAMLIHQTLVPF